MEKTLITGGAGFLGSHLCDYFIGLGHEVICMDNLIKKENIENIADLMRNERFKFIKYDVTDYLHVKGKLDNILHFASLASPKDYLDYPIQTLKVGALGTHKALGLAKEKEQDFYLPLPQRYMETLSSIPNPNLTREMSTRLPLEGSMTKQRGLLKPLLWLTIEPMGWRRELHGSSILMVLACGSMMEEPFRTLWFRR